MGEPVNFKGSNTILGPPKGCTEDQVGSMFVCRRPSELSGMEGCPEVVSVWRLNADEVDCVVRTGRIQVHILGETMPPLWVGAYKESPNKTE